MIGLRRGALGSPPCVRRVIVAAAAFIVAYSPGRAEETQGTPACEPADFKIALDVGHTPEASGATSARGVTEYSYNLQLAKRIETALRQGGFGRTILITVRGTGRSQLLQRTERANALGVDLFLSIHHDDVQEAYHSKWTFDGTTRLFSDKFSGYSLVVSRENPHFERSLDFAKLLGTALMAHGMYYSAHHAEAIPGEGRELADRKVGVYLYDQLVVLKFTKAPAVLLEAGIIVNRVEELVLASPEGRGLVSAAVLEAVNQFCAGR
jgi:N-acetylmuramoyl-L-alanine amidase